MSEEEKKKLVLDNISKEALVDRVMFFFEREKYYRERTYDLEQKIDKTIEYIKNNCVLSDEWTDLGFCNFTPTGKITYKQLTPKKVKELLKILGDKE